MWLSATCDLDFQTAYPTPFIFMLRPRRNMRQWVARETFTVHPSVPVDEYQDHHGNLCQRLVAPARSEFSVQSSADVHVNTQADVDPEAPFTLIQNLPASVLEYLLPSRYCETDEFGAMASEITRGLIPGYQQVAALAKWVHLNVQYLPGTSNYPISAMEVKGRGSGVCRDLAHLTLALCRSLSIPARMVAGYLHGLEPMDMHAWIEAYVGGRWYSFDPALGQSGGARIVLGYGRDAADVAVFNQYGAQLIPTRMEVFVELSTRNHISPP